jgi:hypothetical protein
MASMPLLGRRKPALRKFCCDRNRKFYDFATEVNYEVGRTAVAADEGVGPLEGRDDFTDRVDGAAWAALAFASGPFYRQSHRRGSGKSHAGDPYIAVWARVGHHMDFPGTLRPRCIDLLGCLCLHAP